MAVSTAISIRSKVGRVVYGAGWKDVHPRYFEAHRVDTLAFIGEASRGDISISGGILRGAFAKLYDGPNDAVPENDQRNI